VNESQPSAILEFGLVEKDGWPPVSVESLPFSVASDGYVALLPPLFVKDLSVGDVIDAEVDIDSFRVVSWRHVVRSKRTTIWLLQMRSSDTINVVLAKLREHGCNTVGLDALGTYAVDVPESVAIEMVDKALEHLDPESVAVAFPSMRHHD
jgi:Domain of unknown function (DUF4265)